ncbi:MAG: ABC transporter substrate-binding protein [Eubacteriaceae bacterium]|nr:ABC transporter substrate-binding protein [Eubacteriaceae bacterium]
MPRKLSLLAFYIILCVFAGCSQTKPGIGSNSSAPAREITDMASRVVVLPGEVKSAMGYNAMGVFMIYTVAPEALIGVSYEFNEAEKAYILPEYQNLPVLGQNTGMNLEAIVAAAPDVIVAYGAITESEIESVEALQEQSGIPFVMIDASMGHIPSAYRLLGEVLNAPERCGELAAYAQDALNFASRIRSAGLDPVSVYYGNGAENLETAPQGSPGAELIELIGACNAAIVEGGINYRIDISPEQLLAWNPQVVILNGEPKQDISPSAAAGYFLDDERFSSLQAVADGKIYAIPKYPYSWFDRPNGPNRLIGIYWLSGLLYPDNIDFGIKEMAVEFYSLFYYIDLTGAQLIELLGF